MEFGQLVKERYSIRKFSDRPVEAEKLTAILEAARLAPTAVNKQPYRILVLRGPAAMEKLKTCTPCSFRAPMAMVVCCREDEAWVRPLDQQNSAVIDAAVVGTHIMLAIHDLGLGATWVGHFDPAAFRAAFNLADGLEPVVIFPMGYPASDARAAAFHAQRRSLEETVSYVDC